ncbi:MAG TPA: PspC domain-containing protein [Actinobacteria bacterium]|nr:PspC domain-containing protein [Actinomycetota bacterium]
MWAQSGRRIEIKRTGGKLTRSRSEKWIAGVLGGLSQYFGVDVTLLRLAFIGLVVLLDVGGLILAYIVMAIVVPLEPEPTAPQVAAPPVPQQPVAPPAPPTPSAPEAQDGGAPPADS